MRGFVELDPPGVFGPRTMNAVRALQAENGLETDGIIGPQTRKYTRKYL